MFVDTFNIVIVILYPGDQTNTDQIVAMSDIKSSDSAVLLPQVRRAKDLAEAMAMPSDNRTAAKLVAAIRGEMSFLTPGAYHDYIAEYPDKSVRWKELCDMVATADADADKTDIVSTLHAKFSV